MASEHIHPHSLIEHSSSQSHHHHDHAPVSHHFGGHHLLQVEDLSINFSMYDPFAPHFFSAKRQQTEAIHDLHISVHAGEIVAIVGASGSGKTLLANAILGIFAPNAHVTGRIWFDGVEQSPDMLAKLRGQGISLVPQSINSLDPLMKVGRQIQGDRRNRARMLSLLARYGLPESVADLYPHELSGGMARRVLLCCALMDDPKVIIADEPTPGLDLQLAAQAFLDFRDFANAGGGVLLITHDIELALGVADRIAVFWEGTVVEETSADSFSSPENLRHPFSKALWRALPEHDFSLTEKAGAQEWYFEGEADPDRQIGAGGAGRAGINA